MKKRGIAYVEAILLILVGMAILSLISVFLIQNISKIKFSSICNEFDYLKIEDACISTDQNLLYLFLSRPIQAKGNISFSLKIKNGFSKVLEFNNETFFEYFDSKIYSADSNINPGEGKSFIIFLDHNSSKIEEISVNVVKIGKNTKVSCDFGHDFKIKNCSNLSIENIQDIIMHQQARQQILSGGGGLVLPI